MKKDNFKKSAYSKVDDPNYYDYLVKPETKGKILMRKILLIVLYSVLVIACCTVCILFRVIPVMCLVPVLVLVVRFFTWRYACPEYIYTIESANISFAIVYGGAKRKELSKYHIKDIETIAPYKGEYKEAADAFGLTDRMYFVSSMEADDIYYLIVKEKDGKKKVIFINAPEKSVKRLRYYNENTVVL